MTRAWTSWLAWGTWLVTLGLYTASYTLIAIVGYSVGTQQNTWAARSALFVAFGAFATVGAFVASRQPRNAVGWIFLGIGLLVGLAVFGSEYANYVVVEEPGSSPGGRLAAWFYMWTWYPVIALMVTLPMLFPDGRPPGRRWRLALWAMIAVSIVITALSWVRPGRMSDPGEPLFPDNPIGIAVLDPIYGGLEAVHALVALVFLGVATASAIVRFRRSRGDERQQLKWMTYGFLAWVVTIPLAAVDRGDVSDVAFALTIAVPPAAMAIAMFKYRLYEIDRVISRTLVYAALTVILGAAYAGLVLAGQAVFSSFAGGGDLAIAGSTLVVAALFLPARAWVQGFVDRRFYRRRYDAQRTLEAFGTRLREQIDFETLTGDLRGVVEETMQPAHLSLWLRAAR